MCRSISEDQAPFNTTYYLHAYSDLLLAIKECGASVFFSTREHYKGDGLFEKAYTINSRVSVKEFELVSDVRADLAYNKGDFADVVDVMAINPPYVHTITSNKHQTYAHFSSYQPFSRLCHDEHEAEAALKEVPGDMIVIKSLRGSGGHGVRILNRRDLVLSDHDSLPDYPVLVQEFLDTRCGIPGMVDGVHDLRVKIGGGKIWGGTLRTPRAGELRANVAQGGTERHLFPNEIPEDAAAIAMAIDQSFIDYPRYYSIDLARTENGWKLIELNSKPGLSPVDMSIQAKDITTKLANYLYEIAREHQA